MAQKLRKGIKHWLIALIFMASGPIVLSSAFKNEGHPLFWAVVTLGGILSGLALFFGFKAIRLMVQFLFDASSDPTK
ncbi:MAG: DUF6095 family protein [Bacteroidetes bacterium]|nr:DUF6095 family protein [Bacteroidota bacterium]